MSFWKRKKNKPMTLISDHAFDFFPRENSYKITTWFAGNDPYAKELKIQLTPLDWNKLESQQVYQDLIQYLNSQGIQERGYVPPRL